MGTTLILGLGGAGMNIAAEPALQEAGHVVAINTDSKSLKSSAISNQIFIGDSTGRSQTALNLTQARLLMKEAQANLDQLFTPDISRLVLVAGLGGSTGTAALEFFCEAAKSKNISVITAVTLPSEFEGGRREIALKSIAKLKADAIKVISFDQKSAWDTAGERSMLEMMDEANKTVCDAIIQELVA